MAQAKIFKVRSWATNVPTRGKEKGRVQVVDTSEHVFVGKKSLKAAKDLFATQKASLKMNEMYGHTIYVELFEPEIYNDGQLAYYPTNDKYIEKYVTGQ